MAPATRRRAKPKFATELPVRVVLIDSADSSFYQLIENLGPAHSVQKACARTDLLLISRDYELSRDLNLASVSRSDVAETLRAIASSAHAVIECLDHLSSKTCNTLEPIICGISELDWDPGIQAIDTLAHLLDGVSEAAADLTQLDRRERVNYPDPALGPFVAATRLAASQLGCFPDAAKWSLVVIQQYAQLGPNPGPGVENLALVRAACSNLWLLAAASAEVSKGERGPRSSTAQMVAVQRLRVLYESFTGNEATHSRKAGRRYTGVPESNFGRFAEAAFHLMEPDRYLRRGLAEAVSYAVWPCRPSGADSKAVLARDKLERRTLEALERLSVTNNSPPHS